MLGECVVRSAPGSVEALLRTPIASPQEDAALRALHMALGRCVAQGATYSLSPEVVRGTLALAYYRLAHAPVIGESRASR